jgi:hypothetical protein
VPGHAANRKITEPGDIDALEAVLACATDEGGGG